MKIFPAIAAIAALLAATSAHAVNGDPRYKEEGNIKVRFYFDEAFFGNQLASYPNLKTNLMAALKDVGQHSLGYKFVLDEPNTNRTIRLPSRQVWNTTELLNHFMTTVPETAGRVNVLIHFKGMTSNGVCNIDTGVNPVVWDEGLTDPGTPVNGAATGSVVITAKQDCSVNNTAGKVFSSLRDTFVHEVGHTLLLPDFGPPNASCTTRPTAAIMCQRTATGIPRSYKRWFKQEVEATRTAFFGKARKAPVLSCVEWTSFAACDTNCVNGAGFPAQGATEIYQQCVATQCNNICQ
jgi:hypothetical protein